MYDGTVRDNESGMEGKSVHHKTGEEAIEHSLRELKKRLHDEGIVNNDNE